MIFNISSSVSHARALHYFVNWLIWKNLKKSPSQLLEGRRGCSTNWILSRRSTKPGKEVALIWHHIMNMRATRRKIIIEMLKIFPKTISFKCKMAPNYNIPVNIWRRSAKKSCSGLMNTASLKVRHCRNCTLNLFTGDGSLLNWGKVQPGQETIESRAG